MGRKGETFSVNPTGTVALGVGTDGAVYPLTVDPATGNLIVELSAAPTIEIGKVSIDQTTPGTTDSVTVATGQGAGATIGVSTGAAVITDAAGTLQQYLRGLVKLIAAGLKLGAGTLTYNTIAASQTNQALTGGSGGAVGDYLEGLLIVPASTSPGAVTITDGAGSAITVFAGGASSLSNLVPFNVAIDAVSTSGAWKVTTGASVSAVATGKFT